MKKTQFIELRNNIKETLVSFISITMFIALSVGVFTGISWSSKTVKSSITDIFENNKNRDVELIFPYGMDENDINKLSGLEGVDEIEGSYTGYAFFYFNDTRFQAKLTQVRDNLETPILVEGELPTKENELVISKLFADDNHIKIGDKIVFESDNDGSARAIVKIYNFDLDAFDLNSIDAQDNHLMGYLNTNEFTVTGFANSTEFISVNPNTFGVALTNKLQIDCFIFLPKCAFDETSFLGYTDVLIRNNKFRDLNVYSKEYVDGSNEFSNYIKEKAADEIASDKSSAIKNKINAIIETGQNKLDDAKKQINDTEKQIREGKIALAEGKAQLDEALPKLQDGEEEYVKAKNQLDYFYSIFGKVTQTYDQVKSSIVDVENYVEENREKLLEMCDDICVLADEYGYPRIKQIAEEIAGYIRDFNYDIVKEKILEYEGEIDNILDEINNVFVNYYKQLSDAREQLDYGWDQYYTGLATYEDMSNKLVYAEKQLKDGKIKYEEGKEKLSEFKEVTSSFQEYGCTTFTRGTNVSYIIGQSYSEMMAKLRYSMASLFVIVGLLVCYSAISRIVYDQTVDIGTKKALGLTQVEITKHYLLYTGVCIVLGCILGNLIGYFAVLPVLVNSLSNSFTIRLQIKFYIEDSLYICVFEAILLTLVTYLACAKSLNKNAIDLLKGQDTIQGKQRFYEKYDAWNKLSLYTKTIINNCFNEKRRVFGTIIGVLGSTALVVTALTLNDNILDSYKRQYDKLYFFDKIVNYDETKPEGKQEIINLFDKYGIEYADTLYTRHYINNPDGSIIPAFTFVPEDIEQFSKLVKIYETTNYGNEPYQGFWLSNSYHAFYKTTENDLINVVDISGKQVDIKPSGYFESYLTNGTIIMDKQTYKDLFDNDAISNTFIINSQVKDYDKFEIELKKTDGYLSQIDHKEYSKGSYAAFQIVSKALVAIYMVLSILMAFLVILNLLMMFVDEKKRELIVLMINGFSIKQAKKYIYTDTIFLTIIGIVLGLIVGSIVGNLSVKAFEFNQTIFVHRVDIKACLIATGVTTILTIMVSLLALRKIGKFKLTDINKLN